jgi:hypothetical protein
MDPATLKQLGESAGRAWLAVGPLVGVLVGSWLTTRTQRKHWLMDNKRAEYRKLLTTLSSCGTRFAMIYGVGPTGLSPNEQRKLARAAEQSGNVIYNRLFIADEMKRLNVMNRWKQTVDALRNGRNMNAFTEGFGGIMEDIRTAALKDLS